METSRIFVNFFAFILLNSTAIFALSLAKKKFDIWYKINSADGRKNIGYGKWDSVCNIFWVLTPKLIVNPLVSASIFPCHKDV